MIIGYDSLSKSEEMDKQMKAISSQMKKAAKKSDSKILKSHAKGMEMEENPEVENRCKMVKMLVAEGLEMYECGEMEFEPMIEDLYKALKAI